MINFSLKMLQALPRSQRALIVFLHDLLVAGGSVPIALALRTGTDVTAYLELLTLAVPLFIGISAVAYSVMGMYRGLWRYASAPDLLNIGKAVAIAVLLFTALLFYVPQLRAMPRSVPIIQALFLVIALGGPRFAYRLYRKDRAFKQQRAADHLIPVILYGDGDGAELFIRACATTGLYQLLGIVSDSGLKRGRAIHGVPVLGHPDEMTTILETLHHKNNFPQKLIVTERDRLQDHAETIQILAEAIQPFGITLARLPRLTALQTELQEGRIPLRQIAIEDLLNRPQQNLDLSAIETLLKGQRVLITGAGGSIGAEITEQVAAATPSGMLLIENSELALYKISKDLERKSHGFPIIKRLCDIRDRDYVDAVFKDFRPDIVFHAAALKHVPMVELNPREGVLTNAMGSRNVLDAALTHNVRAVVQISTDKAVNPTNVMGATKKLAESYAQSLDISGSVTRFITVRFGNVLGSSGSVVPLFRQQIEAGGPVTITHKDITRYFMTIPEAVQLVLTSAAFGLDQQESEGRGQIFVLDMGQPIRIDDLARQMIRLAGLTPERDIAIDYVGLRPGEKLHEELFNEGEKRLEIDIAGAHAALPDVMDRKLLLRGFEELQRAALANDQERMTRLLKQFVTGYVSDPEFKSLMG